MAERNVYKPAEPEIPAEYPGGISKLRMAIANEINSDKFGNIYGTLKSNCMVNIDAKGKFVDVKTTGDNKLFNNEVERTVSKILKNVTWTPAQKDGKNVGSYYRLPIVMQFEGNGSTPPQPPPPPQPRKSK